MEAFSSLAGSLWRDFRRNWQRLVLFEVLFKFLEAWLLVPLVALALAALLRQSGRAAISNHDILAFLLSPSGVIYAATVCILAVAFWLLEQAGIMLLVTHGELPQRPSFLQSLLAIARKLWRIVPLGASKVVLLALSLAPFVVAAVATYAALLTKHDIYFYVKDRPPVFWLAVSIGALLATAVLALGVWFYVRWSLALPILLLEQQHAPAALRASAQRVRGAGWQIGKLLVGWQLAALLIYSLGTFSFGAIAAWTLERAGPRPLMLILLLLIAQAALFAVWSFVNVVGHSLLTRRLYLARSSASERAANAAEAALELASTNESPWPRRFACASLLVILASPIGLWIDLSRQTNVGHVVSVTAHRGHARAAPENTLSAIRKAIESGADYAEIDVQLTKDGVLVLLHDRDLMRVAGSSRRLTDLTYDEVREFDVGSWFAPAFAGERAPTLKQVMELAKGRLKLNIELKSFDDGLELARAVAQLVHTEQFENDCLVTAFSYNALQAAREVNPQLRTGIIIAHALGDASRLQVDALSVRADHLSDRLQRSAQHQGQEVHVWTVNDPRQMSRFIERGVDNILTSDPDMLIRVRQEWDDLSEPERLLLSSRFLLGI